MVILLGLPLSLLVLHTVVRIVRHFYKFPMPEFMANAIDNPIRRCLQPPDEMPFRLGIKSGMTVLEVGPGNGTYTLASARQLGSSGRLITVDIEPRMIARVNAVIQKEGYSNIEARTANVYRLPFEDCTFDHIYMIAVIGEIPEPVMAMLEFNRVLKHNGTLAFSELLLDPDYPFAGTIIRWAEQSGFQLKEKRGCFFVYTLKFQKS